MENGSGAEKLIASILEEAHAQASAIEWKSTEAISEIKKRLEEGKEALREEFTQRAAAEKEMKLATARTNAELAGRKELLARKRGLIESAYEKAFAVISGEKGPRREALLKKLIEAECEGGEKLHPAGRDRELIAKLLPDFAEKGLTLGENDESIDSGFTLEGSNYFKDCSFAALMEEVKSATETEVTKALFE